MEKMRIPAPVPHYHKAEAEDDWDGKCYKEYCLRWEYETANTKEDRLANAIDDFIVAILVRLPLWNGTATFPSYSDRMDAEMRLARQIIEITED